ncbi:hypothetical protein J2W42_005438 [Rhizobium tibeticum]|uniref:hypothetical protein n=1 Tax=Rhizobium tibeticum TaxID=501024 RepID=UPI0027841158|nr:hypothetical protein [Rhizobium tibeticum]MDP9812568.1 hypothetical protein [Rhizobium tibeticum]
MALGVRSLALQWFGGDGHVPGICEVPLETFVDALSTLQEAGSKRLAIIRTSKVLKLRSLLRPVDESVEAIFAMSPTSVVWGNIGPERFSASAGT